MPTGWPETLENTGFPRPLPADSVVVVLDIVSLNLMAHPAETRNPVIREAASETELGAAFV
jgi:hypothetical protein